MLPRPYGGVKKPESSDLAGALARGQLEQQGVHLVFVELRARLREQMHRYGLFQTLDRDQFYSSVDAAAATLTEGDGFCSWLIMRRVA